MLQHREFHRNHCYTIAYTLHIRLSGCGEAVDITISLRSGELDAPRIILNIVTCGQVVSWRVIRNQWAKIRRLTSTGNCQNSFNKKFGQVKRFSDSGLRTSGQITDTLQRRYTLRKPGVAQWNFTEKLLIFTIATLTYRGALINDV